MSGSWKYACIAQSLKPLPCFSLPETARVHRPEEENALAKHIYAKRPIIGVSGKHAQRVDVWTLKYEC